MLRSHADLINAYLCELDAWIDGAHDTPVDGRAFLAVMRPLIWEAVVDNPEGCAALLAEFEEDWR